METNGNIYSLEYLKESKKILPSLAQAIGLETPIDGTICHFGERVRFAGWILPIDTKSSVELIAKKGNEIVTKHQPNIRRKDVQLRYNISCDENISHGFDFQLVMGEFDNIFIKLNETEIQVLNVRAINLPDPKKITGAAKKFFDLHKLLGENSNPIEDVFDNDSGGLLPSDFTVLSVREFLAWNSFEFEHFSRVESAIKYFQTPDWSTSFITDGIENSVFSAPGIFSDDLVPCRFGLTIKDINYLYFSNEKDCFYLAQHCTNICLIFPEYMMVVGLSEVEAWVSMARDKIPELYQRLRRCESIGGRKRNGTFLGLFLAQSRPYHYIYDYLFGLSILLGRTTEKFNVYGISGFDFFDVSLFDNCNSYRSLSNEEINSKCLSEGGFMVMPCVQYIHSDHDRGLPALAAKLIKLSNERYNSQLSSLEAPNSDLVIWIGVSSEKRRWVEQLEGFENIILELGRAYKKISVLVDGRTFPLSPCAADLEQKACEDKLFDSLASRFSDVNLINIIGLQPADKIYLAQKIDLFISSYATDSIYPSAICAKPGVVYAPPSIGNQKYLHIHHKVIELPSNKVNEVKEPNGAKKAWHETSVSIDWRDIYGCVLEVLENTRLKK